MRMARIERNVGIPKHLCRTRPRSTSRLAPLSGSIRGSSTPSSLRVAFSTTTPKPSQAQNRIYSSVRNEGQLASYVAASSSARRPLVTLWTTSWCPVCRRVSPLVRCLVESGAGAAEGGVGYCEVEYDAPDVMASGLGLTYMINSVPTLLSFDAGEAQTDTKVSDGTAFKDRLFLEEWIRAEARRQGRRGGGAGPGSSIFGGLFGTFKG